PGNTSCVAEIKAAAAPMSVRVEAFEVADANEIRRSCERLARSGPDVIAMCWDSATLEYAHAIADFAIKRRIPTIAPLREYVKAGTLASFGASVASRRRRAAYYADRIIKGAKPADLPIELPTHFELVVNVATAKALGIAVPPSLAFLVDPVE